MNGEEATDLLGRSVLGLTHSMRNHLVALKAMFSTDRDIRQVNWQDRSERGLRLVEHLDIMCSGLSKALAIELCEEKPTFSSSEISVKRELGKLWYERKLLSGREDIEFVEFGVDPIIQLDFHSFIYIFYSLFDNALKYADPNTKLLMGFCPKPDNATAVLSVSSVGLPINDLSCVFTMFDRGDNAWRLDESGTGLGCWSARKYMLEQGGDLTVECDGKMSIFRVQLPVGSLLRVRNA